MKRHKFLVEYNGDWELFDELKKKGMVANEYEYSVRSKRIIGKIYTVSEHGVKYISIATNRGAVYTSRRGLRRRRSVYKIMYQLNQEGFSYIKQLIMEERV